MSDASQSKTLLNLAWPLFISFSFRSLLGTIDLLCAGTLGDSAVAAIGLFFPLEFMFIACWVGTSAALTSHLSRAMGERHDGRLRQLVKATAIIATGLFTMLLAYNEFLFVRVLAPTEWTLPVAIVSLTGGESSRTITEAAAASVSITLPIVIVIILFQKHLVKGLGAGAVKG